MAAGSSHCDIRFGRQNKCGMSGYKVKESLHAIDVDTTSNNCAKVQGLFQGTLIFYLHHTRDFIQVLDMRQYRR